MRAKSFLMTEQSFRTACMLTVWPLVNIWSPRRLTGRYLMSRRQCNPTSWETGIWRQWGLCGWVVPAGRYHQQLQKEEVWRKSFVWWDLVWAAEQTRQKDTYQVTKKVFTLIGTPTFTGSMGYQHDQWWNKRNQRASDLLTLSPILLQVWLNIHPFQIWGLMCCKYLQNPAASLSTVHNIISSKCATAVCTGYYK